MRIESILVVVPLLVLMLLQLLLLQLLQLLLQPNLLLLSELPMPEQLEDGHGQILDGVIPAQMGHEVCLGESARSTQRTT